MHKREREEGKNSSKTVQIKETVIMVAFLFFFCCQFAEGGFFFGDFTLHQCRHAKYYVIRFNSLPMQRLFFFVFCFFLYRWAGILHQRSNTIPKEVK